MAGYNRVPTLLGLFQNAKEAIRELSQAFALPPTELLEAGAAIDTVLERVSHPFAQTTPATEPSVDNLATTQTSRTPLEVAQELIAQADMLRGYRESLECSERRGAYLALLIEARQWIELDRRNY